MHATIVHAQSNPVANLKNKLASNDNDTVKAYTLDSLSMYYLFFTKKFDSSFYYLNQSVNIGFKLKDKKYLVLAYARLGFYYLNNTQLNAGLDISVKGLQLAEQNNITDYSSTLYYDISFIYANLGDSALSMQNALKGAQALTNNKDPFYDIPLHLYGHISSIYANGGNSNLALKYLHLTDSAVAISKERAAKDIAYYYWANYYIDVEQYTKADSVIALGIASCKKNNDFLLSSFYYTRAISYYNQERYKETITAAQMAKDSIDIGSGAGALSYIQASYNKLGNVDSAYYYLKVTDSILRIVRNQSNTKETQQIQFKQELSKKEAAANLAIDNEKSRNKIIVYVFLAVLSFFLILAFIQWRNSMHRKRANTLLQSEKEKVERTLIELKSTQSQLIQSEKMASLGELTAGIAHEIQNPLNFVNNFSEVNTELIDELNQEVDKGNLEEVKAIAKDIKDNEQKINHHGKRADAIVKGMLQHSRTSTGIKEPTDINALCDEYLRLSYHGFRAKDKSFNATFKTDFDESIKKINIIPQDIGRVLLNLINNAFYAVNEKKKQSANEYEPTVTVSTSRSRSLGEYWGEVLITVTDNGNGIPQNIVDKIFQPFFTTKPTGQGTGLGLSLSYDNVKAHGGEIKVETKEGEYTLFIIRIPF